MKQFAEKICIPLILILILAFVGGCGGQEENKAVPSADKSASTSVVKTETKQANDAKQKKSAADEKKTEAAEKDAGKQAPSSKLGAENGQDKVRLFVSRDYGRQIIFDQQVACLDSPLAITKAHLKVETAYDGGFVNSINGLASGYTDQARKKKQDWFWYYNGALAARGAGDVSLHTGDVVIWDYHDWGSSMLTPAIIGAYPHPFKQGGLLLYSEESKDLAARFSETLRKSGTGSMQVQALSGQNINRRGQPTLLIGDSSSLASHKDLQALLAHTRQTGMFCRISSGGLQAIGADGTPSGPEYSKAAACIIAAGTGMGDANPLWVIAFTDAEGAEAALRFLQGGIAPRYAWGALITPEGTVALPGN